MQEKLRPILEIQELDMKMKRLLRVRRERERELAEIASLQKELNDQLAEKEKELEELGRSMQAYEYKSQEIVARLKKLETQQNLVKKVDDFNAITQEMTSCEREKVSLEPKLSDLLDKRNAEEEVLTKIRDSLKSSDESSKLLLKEIQASLEHINREGKELKSQRTSLATKADPEILNIYEKLFHNKKDRVIVSIEHRTCSGCHIVLTAQHENLVRKGKNLVFCEHCSRLHYWLEGEAPAEGAAPTAKRRRRRAVAT